MSFADDARADALENIRLFGSGLTVTLRRYDASGRSVSAGTSGRALAETFPGIEAMVQELDQESFEGQLSSDRALVVPGAPVYGQEFEPDAWTAELSTEPGTEYKILAPFGSCGTDGAAAAYFDLVIRKGAGRAGS